MVNIKILIVNMILMGFDINGKHKDTDDIYDPNSFDICYTHKDTDDIYDLNRFDIKSIHKDTGTFLNKKMISEKIYQKILIG